MKTINFEEVLRRAFEATTCQTQAELARFLNIKQAAVTDARRRESVPTEWLFTLLRLKGINPEWILHGSGSRIVRIG